MTHKQDTPISNAPDSLAEGYDIQDFKIAYRKHHPETEAPMPFIIELIAMQAAVLAAQPELAQPHPSNTEQWLDDLLIDYAADVKIHGSTAMFDVTHTKAKQALLEWQATHTAEAVRASQQDSVLNKLSEWNVVDQQLFIAGLIYKLFMQDANATKVTITNKNFSVKGDVKGDFTVTAQLKQERKGTS